MQRGYQETRVGPGRRQSLAALLFAAAVVLGVAALVAYALGAFSANDSGAAVAGRNPSGVIATRRVRLGTPSQLYWGAVVKYNTAQAPWTMSAVSEFERHARKGVSIISWGGQFASAQYCGGYCNFETAQFDAVRHHGSIPLFSWAPGSAASTDAKVVAGDYDSYLTSWAKAAKAWGHPFFLRFAWEMNGSWFPWGMSNPQGNSAADYVAMWRHVHAIFQRAGATNATWVWCPNIEGPTTFKGLSSLYPGKSEVDWVCLDGYNGDNPWRTFSDLYTSSYDHIVGSIAPDKPMMLGEVAATESGGSKAQWITDMFRSLPILFPKVRAIVWSNDQDTGPGGYQDWPIESSPSATAAFATGIGGSVYASNSYARLRASPIAPPS
jgi:mannan endo-1,4-beta-mannosidase